jgi:SAM-dependent methyltransferase
MPPTIHTVFRSRNGRHCGEDDKADATPPSICKQRGGAFYDDPEVFERYQHDRSWPLNPNRTLEEPSFMEEVGSVAGLRVLDLGCGEAATGAALLASGCAGYTGIDGSQLMVEAARRTLDGTAGTVVLADMEDFEAQPGCFDLVVSRMAFHYLADVGGLLRRCHASLAPGGRIVFSVTHPVITSHDPRSSTNERRQDDGRPYLIKRRRRSSQAGALRGALAKGLPCVPKWLDGQCRCSGRALVFGGRLKRGGT